MVRMRGDDRQPDSMYAGVQLADNDEGAIPAQYVGLRYRGQLIQLGLLHEAAHSVVVRKAPLIRV